MILPKIRGKRFITIRRGGTLTDEDHRLLALWAADCANHVLHFFEVARPDDDRPRRAIEATHAWINGDMKMMQAFHVEKTKGVSRLSSRLRAICH